MESNQTGQNSPTDVPISVTLIESSLETSVRPAHDRILGLDGLRGIAAVGVLFYHYTSYNPLKGNFPFTFGYGVYGVQLFFLISGFVIFMTVERTKQPLDFAKSRFFRLYPVFWLSVLIAFVLHCTTRGPRTPLGWGRLFRQTAVNSTMVAGWFHVGLINGVYWTLSVEMTFYVIMFFILYYKCVDWTESILSGIVAIGIADGLIYSRWPNPISPWLRSTLALDSIPAFLLGVLLYKGRRVFRPSYAFIAILCFLAMLSKPRTEHEAPVLGAVVTAVLAGIVFLATTNRLRLLEWRPLVFLGTISYALYLTHSIIGLRLFYYADRYGYSPTLAIATAVVVAFGVAIMITFWFDQPVTAALRRRFRTKSGGSSSVMAAPSARVPGDSAVENARLDGLSISPGSYASEPQTVGRD